MRVGGRAWSEYETALRGADDPATLDARAALDQALGLLAPEAHARARTEVETWQQRGYGLLTLADPEYPANLRAIDTPPPLLFLAGALTPEDSRSVAVIGARSPSPAGRTTARELALAFAEAGLTVVSGLAAGIDAEVHYAALGARRRTVAVVGTGLDHTHPREHRDLHRQIASTGAVVSQFWPESGPSRRSFPLRNAVMSGLTLGSVIVEAGPISGTRIQARHALAQGRDLILMDGVLAQPWARELAREPAVRVAATAAEAVALFER